MTILMKIVLKILCLSAVAVAIPLSLLEEAKEMRLKTPSRSNKVKRAQEVIMFGNQQNRGDARGFGPSKTEKRAAADIEDNSLTDVATLPNTIPQIEENNFDSNQLENGNRVTDLERVFQFGGGEPIYNLRNSALKDQLYSEPSFSDMSLYSMVEARRKREAKRFQNSYKLGLPTMKETDLSPEELLSLIKLWNAEHRNKMHESRFGWPTYANENEDYDSGESEDENEIEPEIEFAPNGHWVDDGLSYQPHSGGLSWPKQHKRFMVTKRRYGESGVIPIKGLSSDHIPVFRRFVL